MASYAVPIANAARVVVAALPGAPPLVEVRKSDVLHARENDAAFSAVIITIGQERPGTGVFGGGTDASLGPVKKTYELACSVYGNDFGNISTDLDVHAGFVLQVKQALNKTSLLGAPTVYDSDLEEHHEWESQAFGAGNIVSRFGILFYSNEPRNG